MSGFVFEKIGGQAQMHWPGPAGLRNGDGLEQLLPQANVGPRRPRRFRQRARQFGLGHLLEGAASELIQRGVPRQQHHRRFGRLGGVESRDGVAVPRPSRDECKSAFAGQPRPCVRHMDRRGFVPSVDQLDRSLQQRVEDAHHVVAGNGEDHPRTNTLERACNRISTSHRCVLRQPWPTTLLSDIEQRQATRPTRA